VGPVHSLASTTPHPTFFSLSPAHPSWIIQKLSIGCAAFIFVFLFLSLRETMPAVLTQHSATNNQRTNLTILTAYYFARLTVKTIKSLAPPVTAI
jgi:hypothetical protein